MKKLGWAGMLLITAWLILPDIAIAADSSALAWRTPLEALRDNITDKVVPAVLNIMIAVTGIMIMFGDSNHRRMLNIVLGTAMAAQIYYALKAFGLGEILNPAVSVVVNPVDLTSIKITDNVEDFNPLSSFMRQFIHIVDNGSTVLVGYALELMGFLVVIDVAVALVLGLANEDKIRYITVTVLKVGFFMFLIENWVGGSYQICHAIMSSFEKLGFLASGTGNMYLPDSIVKNGMQSFSAIWSNISLLGMSSLGALLGDLFIAFTVLITTFLTGVEMFMARIEFWTVSLITVVLLPFAMHERTSFLAEKAIGAVFALGVKVAVIAFLTAVTCPLLATFSKQISDQAAANKDLLELSALLQLTLACLVVFIMVKRIPQLAQGLISGSPSLTSGDFYDAMPNPIRGTSRAMAFAGSAYGTYKMATNMEGGGTARKADGDTSWLSQTTGTLRNMASIEWNRHNPFLAEEREAEQGIRYMYSMRANSRDIDDTAHGRNDVYDEQGNLSHNHLYAATNERNGAQNKDGSMVKDGRGTNLTHGWTPAPKTDEQMDRNSAEKIDAIFDNFNRKFNNKRR